MEKYVKGRIVNPLAEFAVLFGALCAGMLPSPVLASVGVSSHDETRSIAYWLRKAREAIPDPVFMMLFEPIFLGCLLLFLLGLLFAVQALKPGSKVHPAAIIAVVILGIHVAGTLLNALLYVSST